MNPTPFGWKMFPEGLRHVRLIFQIMAHPQICLTAINYWLFKKKHCLIFLPLSKERPVQVCAYIFQERWCAWLQATYHDPKDWLRGIINWKAFQWESFPFISLQEQKEITGQGIHEMSRESIDEWSWKELTRGRMVQIQIFLQRNSNSSH